MTLRQRRSYRLANAFRWAMVLLAVGFSLFSAVTAWAGCQAALVMAVFWNPDLPTGPVWWLFGWLRSRD